MKNTIIKAIVLSALFSFLMGCEHTIQGMKQDIHEDTASNPPKQTTVVKKRTVTYTTPSSQPALPASPPPLETPPQ